MANWTDVKRIMKGIAAAEEVAPRQWKVTKKLAVWERPLRKSDVEELGPKAPKGDVLGVYVPNEVKEALLGTGSPYFTTSHFDGYPYVLVELAKARVPALEKLLVSAAQSRGLKPARRKR